MNKFLYPSSLALAAVAFLAACDESTTEVTETVGLVSVEKGAEMPECTDENKGTMIYVADSVSTYFCEDKKWHSLKGETGAKGDKGDTGTSCTAKALKDSSGFEISCDGEVLGIIKNGKKGDKGDDGASCTAKALKDSSGFEISCGGKLLGTVWNGKNGDKGDDGAVGASCTAKELEDKSGYKIVCGNDSVGVVKNGKNGLSAFELAQKTDLGAEEKAWLESLKGKDGEGCTAAKTTDGVSISCPGLEKPVTISNGAGCTVENNAENSALVTISCGATTTDIAKSYCLKSGELKAFDPEKQFCYNGELLDVCGFASYNPEKQFCDRRYDNSGSWPLFPVVYGMKKIEIATPDVNYSATWMTENLKYYPGEDFKYSVKCSSSNTSSCFSEGYLYTYAAAVGQSESVCGKNGTKYNVVETCVSSSGNSIQGVCPNGWRVPNYFDWSELIESVAAAIGDAAKGQKTYDMLTSDGLYGIQLPKNGEGHYYSITKNTGNVATNVYNLINNSSYYWIANNSEVSAGASDYTYQKQYAMSVSPTVRSSVNYIDILGTGNLATGSNPDVGMAKDFMLYVRCIKKN